MRLAAFPILQIPSRELPISYCNNLTVAYDEIAWAEICVRSRESREEWPAVRSRSQDVSRCEATVSTKAA